MNARVNLLLDEALQLPPEERSAMVLALLDSLDVDDEVTAVRAWADEIRRRKTDLQSGAATAIPWSEAQARLRAL